MKFLANLITFKWIWFIFLGFGILFGLQVASAPCNSPVCLNGLPLLIVLSATVISFVISSFTYFIYLERILLRKTMKGSMDRLYFGFLVIGIFAFPFLVSFIYKSYPNLWSSWGYNLLLHPLVSSFYTILPIAGFGVLALIKLAILSKQNRLDLIKLVSIIVLPMVSFLSLNSTQLEASEEFWKSALIIIVAFIIWLVIEWFTDKRLLSLAKQYIKLSY